MSFKRRVGNFLILFGVIGLLVFAASGKNFRNDPCCGGSVIFAATFPFASIALVEL